MKTKINYILLVALLLISITTNFYLFSKVNAPKPMAKASKKITNQPKVTSTAREIPARETATNNAIWWSGSLDKPNVAITFDDGPDPRYTAQILDILDQYQAKATFFEVGNIAERHPDLTRQIIQRGHSLGNHTYSHITNAVSDQEKEKQIIKTNNILTNITGHQIKLFRSPYGYFDTTFFTIARGQGMYQIMWSVVPEDWNKPGANIIASRVLQQVQNGSVILLHDGGGDRSQTVSALPIILEGLRQKGLKAVTIEELLDIR